MNRDKTRNVYLDNWSEWNSSTVTSGSDSTYNWTYPYHPISFTVPDDYSTSINISWDGSDSFYNWDKVVIRKNTSDYPSLPTSGTEIYNGSGTYIVDTSAPSVTTFYSAWGYSNGSGLFSSDYMTGSHTSSELYVGFSFSPERPRTDEEVNFIDSSCSKVCASFQTFPLYCLGNFWNRVLTAL